PHPVTPSSFFLPVRDFTEQNTGDALADVERDVGAELVGRESLYPGRLLDGSDDIGAGGKVGESEVAVGIGECLVIVGEQRVGVIQIDVDFPAGKSDFTVVDLTVAIVIAENRPGNGAGGNSNQGIVEIGASDRAPAGQRDMNSISVGRRDLHISLGQNLANDVRAGFY